MWGGAEGDLERSHMIEDYTEGMKSVPQGKILVDVEQTPRSTEIGPPEMQTD